MSGVMVDDDDDDDDDDVAVSTTGRSRRRGGDEEAASGAHARARAVGVGPVRRVRPPPAARRDAGALFVGVGPTKGAPGCGGADARSTGNAEMRQAGFAPTTPASYN